MPLTCFSPHTFILVVTPNISTTPPSPSPPIPPCGQVIRSFLVPLSFGIVSGVHPRNIWHWGEISILNSFQPELNA